MARRTRKTRSVSASAEPKAPSRTTRGKRSADDEAIETSTKKARTSKDDEEPGPEPMGQPFAQLEKKIKELIAQNQQLKEQLKSLHAEEKPQPEEKLEAKAQPKVKMSKKTQPKRKAAKTRKGK